MKQGYFLAIFIAGLLFVNGVYGQYCGGTSGSNICTALATFKTKGFQPSEDSLPCIIIGQPYSQVIQFHTPSNATVGGSTSTLNYLKIDTISNLPCGLCWAMGESNFQINGNSTGCIKISGTTFDAPGEYKLHIIVDENVTPILFPQTYTNQNLAAQGLTYYVKVQLPNDTCIHIDTTLAGNTASHAGTLAAPAITGSATLCAGGSTTLTATGTNIYAYQWSNGTFNSSITITTAGTYTVTVYGECTSATASKTITLSSVRDTLSAGGPTTFCQGASVTLSVPAGSTAYNWSDGETTSSINAGATGTYVVTVTNSNGCSAASAGISVTVNPLPADNITASGPLSFCTGGSVVLSGPSGLSYQWSNSATTQNITVTQSGNYALIVTDANNCSAVSSPVIVTISAIPNDTITANGATSFCTGDSVILSGAAGLKYVWSTGATTQSIKVTQGGSYTLTVSNINATNCSAVSAAKVITVNNASVAVINAGSQLTFCSGDSVVLTADPGVNGLTYNWSTGAISKSITVKNTGSYNVTVTNSNNCSAASSSTAVTVSAGPADTITAGGPLTFCTGSHVTLTASAGTSYRWSNSATAQSITVSQTGSFTVTVSNANNCSAVSAPVAVTVNALPNDTVTAGGPTTFCSGASVNLTAAAGLTYKWSNSATSQGIAVTQSGSYVVTVTNTNNCSAASSATVVTVKALPNDTVTASGPLTFCANGSVTLTAAPGLNYLWSNNLTTQSIVATQGGNYLVTVTSANQCTAVSAVKVVSIKSATVISTQPVSQVSCINGAVMFNVVAGADSITYQWQKNGVNISGQNAASYSIAQAALADTGNYRVIISGVCGKDTSATATLSVASSLTFSQQPVSQITCLGQKTVFTVVANGGNTVFQWRKNGQNIANANAATYVINNTVITDTGTYTCYVTSSCGNATSNSAILTVKSPSASTISQTICSGNQYNFNGRLLTATGTYLDTLTNHNGCDSIITLALTVSAPITHVYYDSVCAGSSYNFNGTALNTAGVYTDTVVTTAGCDSVVTLHLTVKQAPASNSFAAICQGGTYSFNGLSLTTAGTYHVSLTSSNGCDSTAYINLTVNQPSATTLNVSICPNQSYSFNGHALTAAGTYYDTLTNKAGCDSFITLNLTNITVVTHTYNDTICAGGSYLFNGRVLTTAGNYADTLVNSGGCDSIVTVRLVVNPISRSSVNVSVCAGTSYSFGGHSLTSSGVYYDTLANRYGCDSIITLNLAVDSAIQTTVSASVCTGSSYLFNGQHLNTAGTYHANFTAQSGCDSTVTLVLKVGAFVTDTIKAAVCQGSFYNFNGRQIAQAGSYNDTLTAQAGCDSVVILNLTVTQPVTDTIGVSICTGGSYDFHGQHLTAAGTYNATLTASTGCDSIVTLLLQTTSHLTSSLSGSICQGSTYNFNGQNLSVSGMYHDTLTALGGCDSIVTLTLTVNQPSTTTINALICPGSTYPFNGTQVGATGTYFEALTGTNGCDSIVKLELVVNTTLTVTKNVSICYGTSYNFNNNILTASGTFTDTLTAQGGCDSAIILNLTVDTLIQIFIKDSICAGGVFAFNGRSLTQAGLYIDTLQSARGCDSIVSLNLAIKPDTGYTVDAFATQNIFCTGDSTQICATQGFATYSWNNNVAGKCFYTGLAASYIVTATDFAGCRAISSPLIISTYPTATVSITETGDTLTGSGTGAFQWYFNNQLITGDTAGTIIALHSGNYAVALVDSNGCHATSSVTAVNTAITEINGGYGVALYPNPANGIFTLAFTDDETREIEITDALGRVIMAGIKVKMKTDFDTQSLAAGVYFLRIRQNNEVRSLKFIVAK